MFLTDVGPRGHAFLDRRLYLPEGWAEDAARRAEAGVPLQKTCMRWQVLRESNGHLRLVLANPPNPNQRTIYVKVG